MQFSESYLTVIGAIINMFEKPAVGTRKNSQKLKFKAARRVN
jgi:hypothetical protein